MINKYLRSVCCNAPVRIETWISKVIRRVYFCVECEQPAEVKMKEGLFDPQKKGVKRETKKSE